ncbi:hypothetical protein DFH07DRAFT_1055431 [Mycena maculata]|uniref:Lipid droplet-associated perilipin protein n=1 Tax=Mycena maculata TaxID=230809 RepID=A0AAD7KCJ1_9AGAR|nr:hypothetical protein DFH07DRAFT_1055431 [Mycena maculata]
MSTSTVPMPKPSSSSTSDVPEMTILNRVAEIPMIACAIQQLSSTLSTNSYTAYPYSTAKNISVSAYDYSKPLQIRLSPVIKTVDGYANKSFDVVKSSFPYPFEAQPEDVATFVRQRRDSAVSFVEERRLNANKAIDERVRTPAINAAVGIDQRFTPLVDYLEKTAATQLHTESAPADTQYQYQRVYVLSRNVTGQLYDYSNQTVLVQRASQTADSISALASSAQSRILALSESLRTELQRVQASLAATGASAQHSTTEAGRQLAATIRELGTLATAQDLTVNEKVARARAEVEDRIRPLLAMMQRNVRAQPAPSTSSGNGHVE